MCIAWSFKQAASKSYYYYLHLTAVSPGQPGSARGPLHPPVLEEYPSLIDWVKPLRPTQHKTGHIGDVPEANLLAWYGKTNPNITKASIHQSKQMSYNAPPIPVGLG